MAGPRIPAPRIGSPSVRHRLLVVFILLALLALSGRLVWVQGLNSRALAAEAKENRTVEREIPALRGQILDRNGSVLADSVERYDLWVNQLQVSDYNKTSDVPKAKKGIRGAARKLAPVLGWTPEKTAKALTGDRGFSYLKKSVDPAVRDAAISLRIPGIGADRVSERSYPAGKVAGNVIGFVGADGTAWAGTELAYDKKLRGKDGKTVYERGASGQALPTGRQDVTPAVDGQSVELTVDQDLQWRTQQILAETVDKWGATGGSAVVLDPHTGEVYALADYPTYDPNQPGKTKAEYRGNQSISNVFAPGSTGKLFTMASAIEEGKVTPSSQYTVPYDMEFKGNRIKDSHPHPTQRLTLAGVLKHSSNVGTVQIANTLTPETRYEYLQKFGIGEKSGLELPGESGGILHPADQWTGRTEFTTAFGQGYSVTALQITSAISTFANDGVRVQPTLVRGTVDEDGTVNSEGEPEKTRVISARTAATMRNLMDNDIPDDGSNNADVDGYAIGGKTGTAEVGDGTYTASFIGMAPVDDPGLVVGVFVYGLNTFISGNTAAAPAFSEIMQYALQNQRIAPTGEPGRELDDEW